MISQTDKFKWLKTSGIIALCLTSAFMLYGCSKPSRTPKILDYATRLSSDVPIKLLDCNGLPLDLSLPNVAYNGVVTVELDGKKYPPALCDPDAAKHFMQQIRDEGFFLRYRAFQPVSRDFTSIALSDDLVFLSGGNYGLDGSGERVEAPTYRTYVYNRVGESLIGGPNMMPPRRGHQMIMLKDKRVLIAGGTTAGGKPVTEVQIYDPVANSIKDCGRISRPRTDFLLLPLADGGALIAGGRGADDEEAPDKLLSSVEIFDNKTNKVSVVGQMHEARLNARGFAFGKSNAIIFGGIGLAPSEGGSPVPATSVEIYGAN